MYTIFIDPTIRFWLSIGLVLIIIVIIIRFRAKNNLKSDSLELLERRYQRGEISQEVYERARKRRGK
ncbi:MAG: SHOCT domain-containing protein [Bacillota bacterium]|uniref:SHOCT domain-containing protein n=1 Tax=unclassified Virgibacillus TaxID=2620237 RepID=UPI0003FCFA64|nr:MULTISPECIES: SHOCT domain-containing protein [Bacillaceae]MCC2250681.1 SHOCT domain-containing protein [Virgibacillus sp. AGTR]MDY7046364.1 SHOCT domain-containing protein [Virgibacillus sp. M23]QRZ19529.1 SHOCT domain-containing protein [Virgibacillus sp. AGTR]